MNSFRDTLGPPGLSGLIVYPSTSMAVAAASAAAEYAVKSLERKSPKGNCRNCGAASYRRGKCEYCGSAV